MEELDEEVELVVGGVDVPGVVDEVEAVLEVELVVPRVPVLLELVPGVVLEELVLPVVDSEVLDVDDVVPRVSGVVPEVVLEELSVVAVVPKVAGVVPELVKTVSVEPVVTIVVLTVPDEVLDELPVLVSGPLDEPEAEVIDVLGLLGDGVGVMMHLHALLTLSDLLWQPPRYVGIGTFVFPGAINMEQKGDTDELYRLSTILL